MPAPIEDDILSLKHQLVNWLFTPIFLLLLFTMAVGYVAAIKLADQPYDLALLERARLLASQLDRAPDSVLAWPEREGLWFSLSDTQGKRLAANADLPRPRPDDLAAASPRFRDAHFLGRKIRLVTYRFPATRYQPGGELVVQAAEAVEDRVKLSRSILSYIVVPQFLFILIAGLAVWLGLKRGFEPVERLRRAVARRRGDDMSPLDEEMAPSEVRPLIREMNRHIARSQGLMEQHQRFVANAAHQLRTPFAGLKAQAELARRAPVPPETGALLEGICEGTIRCSHLVNQLLTLARNEPAPRDREIFKPLDLERLAQESARHWAPEALRQGIDLGFEGTGTPLPLLGDEPALRDLIDNLLDNAIRYTPAGGWVTLRAGNGDGAWLSVEDNGPGIPESERERVFDRFYRIAGSGQPGSGLGLAIVLEVARRHGAGVELGTGPGGIGASFRVHFPPCGANGLPGKE